MDCTNGIELQILKRWILVKSKIIKGEDIIKEKYSSNNKSIRDREQAFLS